MYFSIFTELFRPDTTCMKDINSPRRSISFKRRRRSIVDAHIKRLESWELKWMTALSSVCILIHRLIIPFWFVLWRRTDAITRNSGRAATWWSTLSTACCTAQVLRLHRVLPVDTWRLEVVSDRGQLCCILWLSFIHSSLRHVHSYSFHLIVTKRNHCQLGLPSVVECTYKKPVCKNTHVYL